MIFPLSISRVIFEGARSGDSSSASPGASGPLVLHDGRW